jgi:UDP-3-O-[3-hydroxymyristoyl] glucosamine N-acyltransferase
MRASEIGQALGAQVRGRLDLEVGTPAPVHQAGPGSVTWLKSLDGVGLARLSGLEGVLLVHPMPRTDAERAALGSAAASNALMAGEQPRRLFAQLMQRFFAHLTVSFPPGTHPTAQVDKSAKIGERVAIAAFCFVGPGVEIGDDSVLFPHAVIHAGTRIGRRCRIQSHAVVGSPGFGYVREDDGTWLHVPHVGHVVLEDEVEIKTATEVERPALGVTLVKRGSKVDGLCQVGHGAQVGPDAIVTACTEIGAGVVVGEGAWLGPNSCSLERVTIGAGALVGLGAVVTRDVAPGAVVAGSPAEPVEHVKRTRRAVKELVDRQEGKP